jgi:endonuclease/exonuclease/phosphatase family metal-dependent hydrolase
MMRLSIPFLILALVAFAAVSAQSETSALRLATWNLEHLAADDDAGCRPRSDVDYERLRHHAERLNADLIALQEVENRAAVARVFDPSIYAIEISHRPSRSLGTCRRHRNRRRTMQRTGLAINRGRLAEMGLRYRRLPDFQAIGIGSQRWATRISIEPFDSPEGGMQLVSVHLKSGCAYNSLEGAVKRDQCRLLLQQRGILEEWIDSMAGADEPFVLLGDFNRQLDQPRDDFWAEIDDGTICLWTPDPTLGRRCRPGTRRPDSDADLVLANAGKPYPFSFNPRYPYAIDHIVFDSVTARRIAPESYAALDYEGDDPAPSDHHPVTISLRLPRP